MRLTPSIDFSILEALSDGERQVAVNLAIELDADRSYINTRLPLLRDYGLVEKVGPHESSGLYHITAKGIAALQLQNRYGDDDDFDERVAERAEQITIERPKVVISNGSI